MPAAAKDRSPPLKKIADPCSRSLCQLCVRTPTWVFVGGILVALPFEAGLPLQTGLARGVPSGVAPAALARRLVPGRGSACVRLRIVRGAPRGVRVAATALLPVAAPSKEQGRQTKKKKLSFFFFFDSGRIVFVRQLCFERDFCFRYWKRATRQWRHGVAPGRSATQKEILQKIMKI